MILISALFVVVKKEFIKKSIIYICLLIIFLTLFSGSVFTKLQVDHLLSIFFFAVLWIYFTEAPSWSKLISLSAPVVFLFLIKEIGLALGVLLLGIIFLDLLFQNELDVKDRFKMIIFVIMTGLLLILLKGLWKVHCDGLGLIGFSSGINFERIMESLDIFTNEHSRKGLLIFLKGLFWGEADRLNLPYTVWYGLIAFLWIKLFKGWKSGNKKRYIVLLTTLSVSFLIYIIMNYFMQVIIFEVGSKHDFLIGLTRYLNVYFSPIVIFSLLIYVKHCCFKKNISNKVIYSFVVIVCLILSLSRAETSLRREEHFLEAEKITKKIQMQVEKDKIIKICIVPGKDDNHLWIKFLYYLLPNKVNHGEFPAGNKDEFLSSLRSYDYVFSTNPESKIKEWTDPYAGQVVEAQSFFKINKDIEQSGKNGVNIILERLF